MPILQTLKDLIFSNSEFGRITEYKSFISLLRQKHIAGVDKWKEFKKHNVDVKLKNELISSNGQQYINLSTIIKFSYQCKDILQFCNDVTKDIEDHLLKCSAVLTHQPKVRTVETVKHVYDFVSKSVFTKVQDLKGLFLNFDTVPSLFEEYRYHFTEEQWDKILLFEYHFDVLNPGSKEKGIDEQVKLKYNFLLQCQSTQELGKTLVKQHQIVIKERKQRKEDTAIVQGQYLKGQSRHIADVIDSDLSSSFENLFQERPLHTFAVNCSGFCKHDKGLHVIVSCENSPNEDQLTDIANSVTASVREQHNELIVDIVFILQKSFSKYENEHGGFQRFHFFDDLCQGKLSDDVILVFKPQDGIEADCNDDMENCKRCFESYSHKLLHWKTFDIDEEWCLGVPLQMQIILETFINDTSLTRSSSTDFIRGKLTRLYTMYDSLLNIFNRNHLGILQELFTNELIYNYHNVTTVFSITSLAGVTRSLSNAERLLKEKSDSDFLYWDTFIREHELSYDTDAGFLTQSVSLRMCHLVLGLDNLVRLTFSRDPERGKAKSNQVCTLPITIKGLPMDSSTSLSWHDDTICEGGNVCLCNIQKTLRPTDFATKILERTDEEQNSYEELSKFMTWSQMMLWKCHMREKVDVDLNMSIDALHLVENVCNDDNYDVDGSSTTADKYADEQVEDEYIDSLSDISSIESDPDDCCPLPVSDTESFASSPEEQDDIEFDEFDRFENEEENRLEKSLVEDFVPLARIECQTTDVPAASKFPFDVYDTPPLIERHPPPATGRDDDMNKLREVLDDIIIKSGRGNVQLHQDRILFAPDHKIGKNLLKLLQKDKKYRLFLPEFPLLHLRKSKIINLCSAYKSAGLVQLLMYMNDEDTSDWLKLIGMNHIDTATRSIRRLSLTFHLVLMDQFMDSLPDTKQRTLENILSGKVDVCEEMQKDYATFLSQRSDDNATFALHLEMMQHCDEVVAIYVAERIGGRNGYNLLLSAVKSSLPFSFLNGASSYAAFCMQLLHEHYSCGPFWQGMKTCLFSTKYKESTVNIALDTQREMDHRDALKGFRPRGTLSAILPRMSLVDMYEDVLSAHSSIFDKTNLEENKEENVKEIFKITAKDVSHILPTAKMMINRIKSVNIDIDKPYNVYASKPEILTDSILDRNTNGLGVYLMYRYAVQEGIFGLTQNDMPPLPEDTPKELTRKVKTTKGTTVQRSRCKPKAEQQCHTVKEKKRQQKVLRMKKTFDCMSSDMNLCQAILKPDCSKTNVAKSVGMKHAVFSIIEDCLANQPADASLTMNDIYVDSKIPAGTEREIELIVIEFAGVKFKVPERGLTYMEFIEQNIIGKLRRQFPSTKHLIICEEKYSYTPDDLKAATGSQRSGSACSISHLKSADEILTSKSFDRKAVTSSVEGKKLISKSLAANIEKLKVTDITIDVDSELLIYGCTCQAGDRCTCPTYSVPIRAHFGDHGFLKSEHLSHVKQRKGEAEMAQMDWIIESASTSRIGSILSVVTSGDIDALVIHLFAVSRFWPRDETGRFVRNIYLMLQKVNGTYDYYCVTNLILAMEGKYGRDCCLTIATILCIGGNDFLPKFNGKSHTSVLMAALSSGTVPRLLSNSSRDQFIFSIDTEVYLDLVKRLYCPNMYHAEKLSIDEVRQCTIKNPTRKDYSSPEKWMPPQAVLMKLAKLVNCQIHYLLTAGDSSAFLPDFQKSGCLRVTGDGTVEYDFGSEVKVATKESLLTINEEDLRQSLIAAKKSRGKRGLDDTPQKGLRRKRKPPASTPRKLIG